MKFKNKAGEIFHSYTIKEPYNLDNVLETYQSRIDYEWVLDNKDDIKFEVAQNVDEICIIC